MLNVIDNLNNGIENLIDVFNTAAENVVEKINDFLVDFLG
jgi:predicted fused transcriptional regulator/phosphomethylpyrimidine kinase